MGVRIVLKLKIEVRATVFKYCANHVVGDMRRDERRVQNRGKKSIHVVCSYCIYDSFERSERLSESSSAKVLLLNTSMPLMFIFVT